MKPSDNKLTPFKIEEKDEEIVKDKLYETMQSKHKKRVKFNLEILKEMK